MTTLEQVDPNLYAAQQALGPDATVADYEAYSAALDASNAAGASPLGPNGSPGDVGGPALTGTPDAATTAAIAALGSGSGSGGGSGGSGDGSGGQTAAQTTAAAAAAAEKQAGQSASATISAFLSSVPGLAALDPTGIFTSWMTQYSQTLAGQGLDSGDIVTQIEATMNNPVDPSTGTGTDAAALAVFNQVFPGYNQKIQNGTTNSDGSYTGIAGYVQYASQLQQFGTQAGLLPNTISPDIIGNLWASNVSSSEVSQRITDATVATTSAPQPVQAYLAANYGMTPGALTSYYLNPNNTLQQITQNLNAGMVGGAAAASGFDQDLGTAQAGALAAFLANGTGSGGGNQVGTPNNVGFEQATNAFTSGLGSNLAGGQLGSAAQMIQGGYLTQLPGQAAGTVTEAPLLGSIEGNAADLQASAQAQQTRTASAKGGGGATATAKGAVGVGFAQD